MDHEVSANVATLIDPNSRRLRATIDGIDVTLADGQTWVLAHAGLAPILTFIRDELYDHSTLSQRVPFTMILQVAWVCLLANYRLTDDELSALLTGLTETQEQALVDSTMDVLFGYSNPKVLRGYTEWALSALYANGLDPSAIPVAMIPTVLEQLVRTGRAVPESKWTSAGIAAVKRAAMLAKFENAGIQAIAPPPQPSAETTPA